MGGLLDGLLNPAFMKAIDERRALVTKLAGHYGCTYEAARDWLDAHDAYAINTAKRILKAEPYTDIHVPHGSYH